LFRVLRWEFVSVYEHGKKFPLNY